ncbi:hypothetical protein MKW92_041145 [Papaver armeniacum]|nr:hypothetical protein MKW92_041145 [Papaver armeniacum]
MTTAMRQSLRVAANGATKTTDKRYCATIEQAIDARTRMVLLRMLNYAVFDDINGCISTGKQANVYHATKHDGQEFAVKVYKISVLGSKDRDPYIQGDYRFRHGYRKHNPWKVAKTRAEKEMSNLMRLKEAGIRCPTPIHLKLHVLVMEFIGKSGWAATRLKVANLSEDEMRECYVQGNLHIINVSQSVDLDHPLASDIFREDCTRVSDFFRMNGVGVMTMWELFNFIVDSSISDESVECYLEKMQHQILFRDSLMSVEDKKVNNLAPKSFSSLTKNSKTLQIFYLLAYKMFIPRTLDQQKDHRAVANKWDIDNIFERTDISTCSGTESGTDEDGDSSDTQETLPADKKASRKENKRDRASVEQAIDIDSRARMVLFKMLNQKIFDEIIGCISAGKQVNVYHVSKRDGQEAAVKVYKTSGFKDHRFKQGDCKQNRRKMVKTKAEKEMRNLVRLKEAGIKCPTPILLTLPVLVMEFIGKSGSAAPCLKDANLPEDKMRECYVQFVFFMKLSDYYGDAKFIPKVQTGAWRDLSEYNILYYEDFFMKNGVGFMTVCELLEFIVDSSITDESVECYFFSRGNVFPLEDKAADCISEKQLPKQPKGSATNGTFTEHTNNFGAVSGTDEEEQVD